MPSIQDMINALAGYRSAPSDDPIAGVIPASSLHAYDTPEATPPDRLPPRFGLGTAHPEVLEHMAKAFKDRIATPGEIMKGVEPSVPGMLSEEDVVRQRMLDQHAENFGREQAMAMAGSGSGFARPGSLGSSGGRILTPEGLPIQGKEFSKASQEAAQAITKGPKGAGPMDLTSQAQIPNVSQVPLERYIPPRGISPRLTEALQNPKVVKGIDQSISVGQKIGADRWYHTEPIRQEFLNELGPEQGPKAFGRYMDYVAATSPRSDVPTNIRNASFYYQADKAGSGLPEKLPYPYGHVAQNLHRQNFNTLSSAASPGTWDIFQNPKPASFSQNLQGNLVPGTIDTHAFRNIGMRTGDPRFLETSISQPLKSSSEAGPDTMIGRYGDIKGDKVFFRPQQLHKTGQLSMEEAKNIPAFWASKPNENEYAAAEALYSKLGAGRKIPTADAQAAAWSGAGGLTGLGSPPTHTFPELMNERILYTALLRGEDPKKTMANFIRGQKPLLGAAGAAGTGAAAYYSGNHQQQ